MFGYTPGRDVHHFVSPTGGRLSLSGGEPVMRPEFGSVVGKGWVDAVNSAARTGGVSGVKRVLGLEQAHAKRGRIVFPVPGGYVERTAYNLGHDGMDINHANDASGNVPFLSATSGRVTTTGYSRGYGNAAFVASPFGELVYGHALDGSVRVSPGQSVKPGQWLANIGNSSGPHLHFGFPGGSFAAVEALPRSLLNATMPIDDSRRVSMLIGVLFGLAGMGSAAAAVALPALGQDFDLSVGGTAWTISLYALMFAVTTALYGRFWGLSGSRVALQKCCVRFPSFRLAGDVTPGPAGYPQLP